MKGYLRAKNIECSFGCDLSRLHLIMLSERRKSVISLKMASYRVLSCTN